jgi:hypothetical protein
MYTYFTHDDRPPFPKHERTQGIPYNNIESHADMEKPRMYNMPPLYIYYDVP